MKTLFTFLFLLASISLCCAQQISLSGQVSIYNSKYRTGQIEYVAGAAVSAPLAGETSSDSEGIFQLTFTGLEAGINTSLVVEKAGLEVVNERDILNVVLGRKQPLKVFLAKRGELAQRQTELYDVSVAALTVKHDELIATLRAGDEESTRTLQELEQQLNREFEHRYEAEDIIREQLEAAKERLPEMAKRLAEVNLDFASTTYRQAYDAYLRGDIPGALALLDEEALSDKADGIISALSDVEEGQQDFQLAIEAEQEKASQVYKSYALKADAYELVFDYRSAAEVLGKGIELLEAVKERIDLELAVSYNNLAATYQSLGDYKKALDIQQKSLAIEAYISGPDYPDIAHFYNNLATIYMNAGRHEEALIAQQENISLIEQILPPEHPIIAISYNNLAAIYQSLGDYNQALTAQQKSHAIRIESLGRSNEDVASSYNNISMIHLDLGDYDKALNAQREALSIREEIFDANHPDIANSYNNLALIYNSLDDNEQALIVQQKALAVIEKVYEPYHPYVAIAYNTLAGIHRGLGNYEQALIAQQKALAIREQIFEPNHPDIASVYNNLAMIYRDIGDFEQALTPQQKALAKYEQSLEPDHPNIAVSYNNLALIYQDLGQNDQALATLQQAILILKQALGSEHPTIAMFYHNIADVYYHQNQLDSTLLYEEHAYSILKEKHPDGHSYLQIIKDNFPLYYSIRGAQRLAMNEPKGAIEDFERAIVFSEEKGLLYNQVGLIHYYIQEYTLAIENYEKSYQQKGIDEAVYLNNTGMAYAKSGELMEAKTRFTQLEELIPENGLPYRDWGLYYVLKGELDIALDNLKKAIQLGYDNWDWLRTEEALDPLRDHPRFQALLEQAPTEKE